MTALGELNMFIFELADFDSKEDLHQHHLCSRLEDRKTTIQVKSCNFSLGCLQWEANRQYLQVPVHHISGICIGWRGRTSLQKMQDIVGSVKNPTRMYPDPDPKGIQQKNCIPWNYSTVKEEKEECQNTGCSKGH